MKEEHLFIQEFDEDGKPLLQETGERRPWPLTTKDLFRLRVLVEKHGDHEDKFLAFRLKPQCLIHPDTQVDGYFVTLSRLEIEETAENPDFKVMDDSSRVQENELFVYPRMKDVIPYASELARAEKVELSQVNIYHGTLRGPLYFNGSRYFGKTFYVRSWTAPDV